MPSGRLTKKRRVFVGLSGGVDSAVSAALLKRAGAEAVGAFIKAWYPDWVECTWREERRDAMRVAAHLGIPFVTIDLEKEYKEGVVDYMISEYKAGRTPNPDVMCNKEVKFGAFLRKALEMGADAIATGHYAQNQVLGARYQLLAGEDKSKDQSYFLWTLNQEQLSKTIFPVGHLLKSEVRELARQFRLPVASKKDSQGICFLGHIDMKEFLSHYIKTKPGNVFDLRGRTIGKHNGAVLYTLGERVNGNYVVGKDIEGNTLTVSKRSNEQTSQIAQTNMIKFKDINWISGFVPKNLKPNTYNLVANLRYHGEKLACSMAGNTVTFNQPVLVASGQSVVFYDGEICLGGGVVE